MKQLVCEICGSTEFTKQDGFFACQTCGTKYSVEEAKKMMSEDTPSALSEKNESIITEDLSDSIADFHSDDQKNAQCPLCNSTDLKEENGYYICQVCGKQFTVETKQKKPTGPVFSKKHSVLGLVFGAISLYINLTALLFCFAGESRTMILLSFVFFFLALGASAFAFTQGIIGQSVARKAGGSAAIVRIGSIFSIIGLVVTILGIFAALAFCGLIPLN